MAKVQYVSFADILSRINRPPAFNSVSNGAVNVDCPRANIDGSEKAVEIINNIKAQLRAYKEESERIATKYACWWAESDIRMDAIMKEIRAFRLDRVSEQDVNVELNGQLQEGVAADADEKSIAKDVQPKTNGIEDASHAGEQVDHEKIAKIVPTPNAPFPQTMALQKLPAIIEDQRNQSIFMADPERVPNLLVGTEDYIAQEVVIDVFANSPWLKVQHLIYHVLSRLQFCSFTHVRKLEYEPPPDNATCLGFNPSLEDKAVLTAVQLIHISHKKLKR